MAQVLTEQEQEQKEKEKARLKQMEHDCIEYSKEYFMRKGMSREEYIETMYMFTMEVEALERKYHITAQEELMSDKDLLKKLDLIPEVFGLEM